MRRTRYWVLLLVFVLLACVGANAQANSQVTGIVTDQSGAVVSAASVTLIDTTTNLTKTTVSSDTGLYAIPGLNPGLYNLRVSAKGFEAFQQSGLVVNTSAHFARRRQAHSRR